MSRETTTCDVCGADIPGVVHCTDEYDNPICDECMELAHASGALEDGETGAKIEPWETLDRGEGT